MQHLHNQRNSGKHFFSVMSAFIMSLCFMMPVNSLADYTQYDYSEELSDVSIYDEYLSWSQFDERWSETPMGDYTIRKYGCLVTSLAIMAVDSDSIDDAAMENMGITDIGQFNPGTLANAYTSVNGFTSGGAIANWGTAHQLMPQIEWGGDRYLASTEKSAAADEIRNMMSEGYYVIARVVMPYDGYHWVYIKNVLDDGNIVMCDPAKDESDLYTAYPDGLQGEYWYLKGKNMPDMNFQPEKDEITDDMMCSSETVEYFVQSGEPATVYSEIGRGNIAATLTPGNVVKVSYVVDNYGFVESSDFTGWVDMNFLTQAESAYQATGDINNDGNVDKYDLALLNTYLQQKELLPDGVSTLSDSELRAADMNYDGVVNYDDVVALVKSINN